jgi:hypothetical protein
MDARKGRLNRSRGISFEREIAKAIGGRRTGMYGGKDDVASSELVAQTKCGKMFPERLWNWLVSVPTKADQTKALVIGDAPGAGTKRRVLIVMEFEDFKRRYLNATEED